MDQLLTQLMAGGILAILVIREVLNFLIKHRENNKDGHKEELGMAGSISRAEFEKHKTQVRYRDTCDDRHDSIQRQFGDIKSDLTEIKSLIRNGHNPL